MKREKVIVDSRRDEILSELGRHGELTVEALAERLNVSPLTIRRDLLFLEEQKKIERFYGGASIIKTGCNEDETSRFRNLIAEYAAGLVENGDSIFINSSMTALNLIRYLSDKRVTVITNNGKIINMDVPPSVSVILTGGELRYPKHAMVGEMTVKYLESVVVKKSFLGCNGLNPEQGFTTEAMGEITINRIMCERVMDASYILADNTKFGISSSFISRSTKDITHIITDEKAPKDMLAAFMEYGIDIVQVK